MTHIPYDVKMFEQALKLNNISEFESCNLPFKVEKGIITKARWCGIIKKKCITKDGTIIWKLH